MATADHPNAPSRKSANRATAPTKPLPHNVDAEASILGGLILKPELLALLATLEISDFYHWPHKVIFEAIRNLEASKTPIDVTTIEVEIEKRGKLEAAGGIAYLGELACRVPTVDNVLAYTKIVRDQSMLRRLNERARTSPSARFVGTTNRTSSSARLSRAFRPSSASIARPTTSFR
jgi:replicative DNA helicase